MNEILRQPLEIKKDTDKSPLDEQIFVDVIHKIKNGLGGIDGFAALLERDLEPDDPRRRLAQRVQDGVKKVNEVAVAVMFLAREMEAVKEPVRIGVFMKQVFDNSLPLFNETQVDIRIDETLSKETVKIEADPRALQRMVKYAIQAISKIAGRLVAIEIINEHQNKVSIQFSFTCEMLQNEWPDNFNIWLENLHAIEARLAFMVVTNIMHNHQGQFIMTSDGDIHCLHFTFKRDI